MLDSETLVFFGGIWITFSELIICCNDDFY